MSKGVFPRFMREVKRDWKTRFPELRPVATSALYAPKSSSFVTTMNDAADGVPRYLFLNFQPASKAWLVGQFTINVMPSFDDAPPDSYSEGEFARGAASRFRIGGLLGGRDKWWCLEDSRPEKTELFNKWRASSYDDEGTVFSEVLADVNRDVAAVLERARQRGAGSR